jgi:hypothetical protein
MTAKGNGLVKSGEVSALGSDQQVVPMNHRGIEYAVVQLGPDSWKWEFRIGDRVFSRQTETKLRILAERRVRTRIDQALRVSKLAE